jgi:hypothetical protein
MLKKLTIISLMFFTAAVALPAAASAQGAACGVYCEEVPDAGGPDGNGGPGGQGSTGDTNGGSATDNGGSSTGSGGTTPLSDETQGGFDALGGDGKAAAELAQQGSPDAEAIRTAVLGAQTSVAGGADDPAESSRALLGLAGGSADADGDGLGIGLPIALGVALFAAVAFLIARRRRDRSFN